MRFASILFSSLLLLSAFGATAQDGEKLFKQNCATCHLATDKTLIGPGLAGIEDRAPGGAEWVIKWVQDPDGLIASGDAYANEIKEFSPTAMTAFGFLSDDEILAILDYVKNPPAPEVVEEMVVDSANGSETTTLDENTLRNVLFAIAGLLLVLIIVLSSVRRSLTSLVDEKTGKTTDELGTWGSIAAWMNSHRGWVGVGFLVITLAVFMKATSQNNQLHSLTRSMQGRTESTAFTATLGRKKERLPEFRL
jgi:cytochrome c2